MSGYHRLEACRQLGWTEITAQVVDLSELEAELAGIDKNLIRNELTVLERGEQLRRRKEIYEALHPETKQGGSPGKKGGGKVAKNDTLSSFAEDTADKTKTSARTIQREIQIAKHIAPEVLARDLLAFALCWLLNQLLVLSLTQFTQLLNARCVRGNSSWIGNALIVGGFHSLS